jgi:hypothetical protein
VKDLAVLLEQFQRRGVSLVSVAESLDTGSTSGRLVLNIMVSVSQWEREAIGERTRDAMRHKKSKLEFLGNAPYGYRQAADKRHVEPEPGEQAILERIQRLRKGGKSLRKIADQLNRLKIRTRHRHAREHLGLHRGDDLIELVEDVNPITNRERHACLQRRRAGPVDSLEQYRWSRSHDQGPHPVLGSPGRITRHSENAPILCVQVGL